MREIFLNKLCEIYWSYSTYTVNIFIIYREGMTAIDSNKSEIWITMTLKVFD